MNFRGLELKRVWKLHFWSEIGSGFGERGGTPHQEFPGVPPPANDLICYSPSDREATFLYIALTYIIVSSNASMSIQPKVNIKCL